MEGARQPPFRFFYGREYTEEDINEALSQENPLSVVPSVDTNGHGTFLASIAAGRRVPSMDFTGASPKCMLGIVKLKQAKNYLREYYMVPDSVDAFQSNDIMLAITYLRLLAPPQASDSVYGTWQQSRRPQRFFASQPGSK